MERAAKSRSVVSSVAEKGDITRADGKGLIAEAQARALTLHHQADVLREAGRWEEAIADYKKAIRLNPEFSWSYHSLGDCYKKLGDWSEAIVAYRRAIALKNDFIWSYYSLGEALEQLEDWSAAAESYRQALVLDPNNEQVPPRLADVLRMLLKSTPQNIELYEELAQQLLAQEKREEAIATYQMALQIRPEASSVALALSGMLADLDPQEAQVFVEQASSQTVTSRDINSPEDLSNFQLVTALLAHSSLFDPIYYRATNPNLASLDNKALLHHYITQGSAAGQSPNPLFDDAYYRQQHPEIVVSGINPLAHYHCYGFQAGADPHPFFSTAFYQETHEDVGAADVDPLAHYLAYGAREGRVAFSSEQFPHLLDEKTPADAVYLQAWQAADARAGVGVDTKTTRQKLGVYCSSIGNYFITEIADFIAAALTQAGHSVTRLSEQDSVPDDLDGHWVVAPHEFFYLGEGMHWVQRREWLVQAVMVNVEQPQTSWFSKAFHFLRHSKIIFDINVKSAAIMRSLGLPAYWLPLGHLADYEPFAADERLPDLLAVRSLPMQVRQKIPSIDAPLSERPLDIHFIGTLNERREKFFAESARWLSQYHCFFHMPPMGVPLLRGQDQALDTETVIGISRRSKILLNVHRDDLPYFEWHRMVFHGLWQNTLVVTEPCHDIPGLVAGEHFVVCELDEMADKVTWLMRARDGQAEAERVRWSGSRALRKMFEGATSMNSAVQQSRQFLGQSREVSVC